jgi:hypothetical protein
MVDDFGTMPVSLHRSHPGQDAGPASFLTGPDSYGVTGLCALLRVRNRRPRMR